VISNPKCIYKFSIKISLNIALIVAIVYLSLIIFSPLGDYLPAAEWRRPRCPGRDWGHLRNLHTAGNCSRIFVSGGKQRGNKESVGEIYMEREAEWDIWLGSSEFFPFFLFACLACLHSLFLVCCGQNFIVAQFKPKCIQRRWQPTQQGGVAGVNESFRLVSHKLPQNNPNYQQNAHKYKHKH